MTYTRQLDHKTSLVAMYYKSITEWYKISCRQIEEVRKILAFPPEINHHEEHTNYTAVQCGYCNRPKKMTRHIHLSSDVAKVSLSCTLQERL